MCDSWKGESLQSVLGKVYCQILLNQIKQVVDKKLHVQDIQTELL